LQFFNKNNAFFAYFGQNHYFKAKTTQLKAFEKQSNRSAIVGAGDAAVSTSNFFLEGVGELVRFG